MEANDLEEVESIRRGDCMIRRALSGVIHKGVPETFATTANRICAPTDHRQVIIKRSIDVRLNASPLKPSRMKTAIRNSCHSTLFDDYDHRKPFQANNLR